MESATELAQITSKAERVV